MNQTTSTNDLGHEIADSLLAFDRLIQKIRNGEISPSEPKKLRNLAIRSILDVARFPVQEDDNMTDALVVMLDGSEKLEQKKTIAICFLRLLPEMGMKWLLDNPYRPRVVDLLDSQCATELYPDRKTDPSLQSHEKLPQFAEKVKELEGNYLEALHVLTSLERVNAHRQNLMSVLRSKLGRLIIHPFLPKSLEGHLGELYTRAEAYINSRNDLGVVDAYRSVNDEIDQFIRDLETHGTLYAQWLSNGIGKTLSTLIREDFVTNKAAQPATVSAEARDKKYPFHQVGQTINLGMLVKNLGPGYAYDTRVSLLLDDENLKLATEEVEIGRFAPATTLLIEVHVTVLKPQQQVDMLATTEWHDFDGTHHTADYSLILKAQRNDINWEALEQSDPYSLEPIITETELVGRKEVLNRLLGTVKGSNIGSSVIHGQKRVGKTSIVRVLQSHLEKLGYLVVYLEGGNYVEPSANGTVKRLGARLCKEIKRLEPRIAHLDVPSFADALSPLDEFLDDATRIAPDRRILVILDEFDELPMDLYVRGTVGDAFFLTLRSISSRPHVGFILVGSEKIDYIMDCQGDQFNKWNKIPVDYFSRESDWTDYKELVLRPVGGNIEYTEDAIIALHESTAGNPYFTKLICKEVFQSAVTKRDCYVTRTEIDQAVGMAAKEVGGNTFQHFWEDGIVEVGELATERSVRRRKILISLSDVLAKQSPAAGKMVAEQPLVRGIPTVDIDLKEFMARKVLVGSIQDDFYSFKVPFFQNWLKGRGVHEIIATFYDLDAASKARQQEEQLKIRSDEIVELVKRWGLYKGQPITEDKVRAWLEQFGGLKEQRPMFTILNGLRFYSDSVVRQKMIDAQGIVRRGLVQNIERGKLKRSDILVSYLDSPAKSGAHFARLYADEASIYVDNVIEKGILADTLRARNEIQALVFVDDFVGTGQSASDYFKGLDINLWAIVRERGIKVVFVVVVAFIGGYRSLEKTIESLGLPVQFHACEILDETAQCFGQNSSIFPDPKERQVAKQISYARGKILEKDCPLGYGGLEMAVVFERSCPNDTLPILWSESTTPQWVPLFKRH